MEADKMESDKIPCTFEGCYLRFNTVEQMKKHKDKAKDEVHEWYCKKCDEDCDDDIAYLIHQIQSRKHIACPVCGAEFRSESGRDRHVGISHRRKQELKCPGCKNMFDSAAALMGHIEKNNCKTITREDFHKHRAEQQIQRDALEGEVGGNDFQNASERPTVGSEPDSNSAGGGVSLLDNERLYIARDWQGNLVSSPRPSHQGSSTNADGLSRGINNLAIDKYPALTAAQLNSAETSTPEARKTTSVWDDNDLWDVKKEAEVIPGRSASGLDQNNVWTNNRITSPRSQAQISLSSRPRAPSSNLLDAASSIDLLESEVSMRTSGTRGTYHTGHRTGGATNLSGIPGASRPEKTDPNAPFATIQTTAAKSRLPSRLDLHRYWDSIQSCYICPDPRCGARLASVAEFEQHLTSPTHIAQRVQCPSCLKKFKTTTALVAHAESGSIKCDLRNSAEYDLALRGITAGLIRVDGTWRDGSVKYESMPVERW